MSQETDTIQTDHLNIKMSRRPGCLVRLEINIDPEGTKAAYTKAVKAVNKEISIPGFRKGKAPDSLVIQQFGKYVNQEWHELLLNTSFREFLEKTQLYPFTTTQKSIKKAEVKNASLDNGALLIMEYEGKPEIPTIDEGVFQLKQVEREPVTKEVIDETLHQIQLRHAEWNEVKDRPVQEGDFVDLTIVAQEDPPRTICESLRFETVQGKMGNWMRNLIIGHRVGDTVEGMSEKEEGHTGEESIEFKPTLCKITINKIMTANLPPLDDELSKKVGVATLSELLPRIEEDLNRRADLEVKDKMRAQVEEILLKKYVFDVPASLIEKQRNELLESRVRSLSQNNVPPEKMTEAVQNLQAEITQELDRAYRLFFISRKIADENNIQVTDKEIMNEMMRQLMMPPGQGIIDASMDPGEARSKLYVNVLSQKVLDFLASKAKVG